MATECLNCRDYSKKDNTCHSPLFKAKYNEKSLCPIYREAKRYYYYFTYKEDANKFAQCKNKLARVCHWIVRSNTDGYTCYCLKGLSND